MQAVLGFVGLACISFPLLAKLPGQIQAFKAIHQVQTSEQIERERLQERKLTADKLLETGILPTTQKLKVRQYLDSKKIDPKPDTTGWLEDEVIYVYDSGGTCIGKIANRRWLWKHKFKNACKGVL
ncbi:hypothetical protein [Nostoc sp. PCC 7107]|uniref:hypothetical protein n=1 Tax=Nostoc sp. PCC 7107 TaxID=317936 RepID=UPI00209EBF06|nr:hypothetical protein [Nostoc sp. PCC 7107]